MTIKDFVWMRVLSGILVVSMICTTLLSAPFADKAFAAEVKSDVASAIHMPHPECGEVCICKSGTTEHSDVQWKAWDGESSFTGSYVYLTQDANWTNGTFSIRGEVTICLNGHSIHFDNGVQIPSGTCLSFCDCTGNGCVTGSDISVYGTFFIHQGVFSQDLQVQKGGLVYFNGGTVESIYNSDGKVHVGKIAGKTAKVNFIACNSFINAEDSIFSVYSGAEINDLDFDGGKYYLSGTPKIMSDDNNYISAGCEVYASNQEETDYYRGTKLTFLAQNGITIHNVKDNTYASYFAIHEPARFELQGTDLISKAPKENGFCGTNLKWAFWEDGTLELYGSGDMQEYKLYNFPFSKYNIKRLIVGEQVTSIAKNAFFQESYLESVDFGSASLKIGEQAFAFCNGLTEINFGTGVISPDNNVFYNCDKIKSVRIPENVIMNGSNAGAGSGQDMFLWCDGLESVVIDCAYIGPYMFDGCSNLSSVTITDPHATGYWVPTGMGYPFNDCLNEITLTGHECSYAHLLADNYSNISFQPIEGDTTSHREEKIAGDEATCTTTGKTEGIKCSSCKLILQAQEEIPVTDHSWDNGVVTKEATYDEEGEITYSCKNCSEIKTEVIEKLKEEPEVELIASGKDGNLDWSVDVNGKLTVTGTGDYTLLGDAPAWCAYAPKIKSASVRISGIKSLRCFFSGCKRLTSVDISGIDTSEVTDMSYMFYGCNELEDINLNGFDTGTVTKMGGMFCGCKSLMALDISGFDTSRVTNMAYMFEDCESLTALDVTGWDTSSVISMEMMFSHCSNLSSLDVSGFDTSKVVAMDFMFGECSSLRSIDVSHFNTERLDRIDGMFYGCKNLESIEFGDFDTGKCTYMGLLFCFCENLTNVDVSHFNTSKATDMGSMFSGCSSLTELDVSGFDTSHVSDMSSMFSGCSSLTAIDVSGFDTSNVEDMSRMFNGCSSLKSLDVSHFDTGNVDEMEMMFSGCNSLRTLDVSHFDTSYVTDMNAMFSGCSSLQLIDLENFDTAKVTDMGAMFSECSAMKTINLSSFNTSAVTRMASMFSGCSNLEQIDLDSFDTSSVTTMSQMFRECNNLEYLNLDGFDTSSLLNIYCMFYHCSKLSTSILFSNAVNDYTFAMAYAATTNEAKIIVTYNKNCSKELAEEIVATKRYGNNCHVYLHDQDTHVWDDGVVTEAATCTAAGSVLYACLVCDQSKTETIPATGHNMIDGVCSICGYSNSLCGENLSWEYNAASGELAISGTGTMRNYTYTKEVPWYAYASQITSVRLPEGMESIGDYAFYGLTALASIEIPQSVKVIGEYAFKNCVALESVAMPEQMTKLGESAFYGCSSLRNITIPEGIYTVWAYTFKNCTSLGTVTLADTLIKVDEAAFYGCSSLTSVEFPNSITIIGQYAFKNCTSLKDVTLPSKLTQLREAVFYGTAIKSLNVPYKVTSVGPYAFKNCVKLTQISLPKSLTKIDEAAFYGCERLAALDIPDAVTTIGNYAFRRCTGLSYVSLPAKLNSVGESAFYGCSSLSELEIPEGTTVIKPYAFKACSSLVSIALPDTLTTLGESALNSCTSLAEITISASVTAIEDYCFSGDTLLKNVTFEGSAPAIGTGAFKNVTARVFYPSGDASWTSEVMMNYGGNLTWKAQ